jgi:hypothetical protein
LSLARRLEQFEGIAGRVLEQDLFAAEPSYDVIAERYSSRAERCNFTLEILDLELDAVPTTWLGFASVQHRLSGATWATSRIEQEAQISPHQNGKAGCQPKGDETAGLNMS